MSRFELPSTVVEEMLADDEALTYETLFRHALTYLKMIDWRYGFAEYLRAVQDKAKPHLTSCGHSACVQSFIDTGDDLCVLEDGE